MLINFKNKIKIFILIILLKPTKFLKYENKNLSLKTNYLQIKCIKFIMKNLGNLCAHITYLTKKVVVEVKKPASKELKRNLKTENSIDL